MGKTKINKKLLRSLVGFDFSKFRIRHVALKFLYLGWDYSGLACCTESDDSVINVIYKSLLLTKLIKDRQSCDLQMCGRTDKGVSAFQQVISLKVRSNLENGPGVILDSGPNIHLRKYASKQEEIEYTFILNKVLPSNIRVLAWAPVDDDFNARFKCQSRTYRYIFPKANLDIDKMMTACELLTGEHDFRHFCTVNTPDNKTNYVRTIYSASIVQYKLNLDSSEQFYVLEIKGQGFLYHQIRYTVSILLMIGKHLESLDIIPQLFDVEGIFSGGKPSYNAASELPLVFYDCHFEDLKWITSPIALQESVNVLTENWLKLKTKESIYRMFINDLSNEYNVVNDPNTILGVINKEVTKDSWKPLLDRSKAMSIEEKIKKYNDKSIMK